MNYAAVDFETYYDVECDIKTLGTEGYILHPKFDAYLVSIVTSNLEWVGHPSEAPWFEITGQDWEWLAHNASFDERVYFYLQRWGKVPALANPRLWNCTADLCAFSAVPRKLDVAAFFLYQEKVSKSIRDRMKGKIFASLTPEQQQEVEEYALVDGRTCLRFWNDMQAEWPEKERRISRLSRLQGWVGLRLDKPALEQDIDLLKRLIWKSEQMIPWNGVEKNLSYPALCAECAKVGISAPTSTAMTSEDCADWEDTYGDKYPWIDAMRTTRRANAMLQKCQTMYDRIRDEDGRMPYQNKYFGAHTGRWGDGGEDTGRNKDGGFNSRNLPRKEMFGEEFFLGKKKPDGTREEAQGKRFADMWEPGVSRGVNLRHRIIPAEGCHFTPSDLEQIEPRVLWAFAGDSASLAIVRQGLSPYEAHAIASMGWVGESLKYLAEHGDIGALAMYQLAKARVLALGYGAGWLKFIMMAKLYISEAECLRIFSAPVTQEQTDAFINYLQKCKIREWVALWAKADAAMRTTYINSWLIVMEFRRSNPKIVSLWRKLNAAVKASIGEDFEIGLPSGRSLLYRKIAMEGGDIKGTVIRYGKPMRIKLYGGLLVENMTQAAARDVFVECLLRLDDEGHWVSAHIHDEAVPEVQLSVSEKEIEAIMSAAPDWMPNLPVAAGAKSRMYYTK